MPERDAVRAVARRRYWREAEARVVVSAWQESGENLATFSREHGIAAARVARWAARLGEERAVRFHPVQLTGEVVRPERSGYEVELPDGIIVRLPAGFELEELRRIVSVLGQASRC